MNGAPVGTPLRVDDIGLRNLVVLLVTMFFTLGVIGLALFDVRPFGSSAAVYVLAFIGILLLHGVVGAGVATLILERQGWSDLGRWHLVALAIGLAVFLLGSLLLDAWMLLGDTLGARDKVVVSIALLTGWVGGAVLAYFVESPERLPGSRQLIALTFASAVLGLVIGALLAAVPLVYGASERNRRAGEPVPDPPALAALGGSYVALGDSYSAGEGIEPFMTYRDSKGNEDGTLCHRSDRAYSYVLRASFQPPAEDFRFAPCSGAITTDMTTPHTEPDHTLAIEPQLDGADHPEAKLVTLTMVGNDLVFSQVVKFCVIYDHCMGHAFAPEASDHVTVPYVEAKPLEAWLTTSAERIVGPLDDAYKLVREKHKNARIVVLGYPYLLPSGSPGFRFNDCDTVLRRFDDFERGRLRELQDKLNDMIYELAVKNGLEFISPNDVWQGHEPCGIANQYTNAIKPIISTSFVDGGSFHPNTNGQRVYARLVACYLNANPTPPNAFVGGTVRPLRVDRLTPPDTLGLVAPPGSVGHPVPC